MPHLHVNPKQSHPSSCLLVSIRRHLSVGRLDLAVSSLPLLSRAGLRAPFSLLAELLHQCLISSSLTLAHRIHLFVHLSGVYSLVPSYTRLANHLLSFHFLRGRPSEARHLFDKMPQPNIFSFNAMLAGYARLGLLAPARRIFGRMPHRDLVSWNTMLLALARASSFREALSLYSQLRRSSLGFNAHTFSGLLVACVRHAQPKFAQQIHAQVLLLGFLSNLIIASSLLDAYAKCGCVDDARNLFDEMPVRDVLAWTALVYGYAKCGDLVSARRLFDDMPERNPVSWTALVGGYVRSGQPLEALDVFRNMINKGVRPDQFTFSSGLCACATIASLKHGKQIHCRMLRTQFNPNAIVLSSLIDMYSKCGDLVGGQRIFERTVQSKKDTVMWNTMISAVGQHGHGRAAIKLFSEMIGVGAKPDVNTFVVLLTACSHSGLVEEGMKFFESMGKNHGIIPEEDHYVCLVDLLGRTGRLQEAMEWLEKMPHRPSARPWNALLGACRIHGNMQLGKKVAERLIELEPQSSAAYVLLLNIHANAGSWDSVENVRCLMEENLVKKEKASSWI